MANKKSKPKRQHWVPKFYLRYFATPESQKGDRPLVYVASRGKKASSELSLASTESVAIEKFLYSPLTSEGTRDFQLEERFCDLEGLLATIWPHISSPSIRLSKEMPNILALFIATLHLRNPARRELIASTHRRIVQQVEADLKSTDEPPTHLTYSIDNEECRVAVEEFEAYKNATPNDNHRSFVKYIEGTAMPVATRLLKKRWTFVVCDDPVFVTGDNPISLRGPNFTGGKVGFGTQGMTVQFPVSPHVVLHLDDGTGFQVSALAKSPNQEFKPWAVYNYEMWTNADRFIYSPRDPNGVLGEIVEFYEHAKATHKQEDV